MNRAERRSVGHKGELADLTVGMDKDGNIVIEFPVQLRWFSMGAKEAKELIKKVQGQLSILEAQEKANV